MCAINSNYAMCKNYYASAKCVIKTKKMFCRRTILLYCKIQRLHIKNRYCKSVPVISFPVNQAIYGYNILDNVAVLCASIHPVYLDHILHLALLHISQTSFDIEVW